MYELIFRQTALTNMKYKIENVKRIYVQSTDQIINDLAVDLIFGCNVGAPVIRM